MPYTNAALEDFMLVELGPVAEALGLSTSDALAAEVAEVALILGHPLADETDDVLIRAISRFRAWTAAESAAVSQFNVALSGGKKFELETIFKQVQLKLASVRSAYYLALVASEMAKGAGTFGFAFGLAHGSRGL